MIIVHSNYRAAIIVIIPLACFPGFRYFLLSEEDSSHTEWLGPGGHGALMENYLTLVCLQTSRFPVDENCNILERFGCVPREVCCLPRGLWTAVNAVLLRV